MCGCAPLCGLCMCLGARVHVHARVIQHRVVCVHACVSVHVEHVCMCVHPGRTSSRQSPEPRLGVSSPHVPQLPLLCDAPSLQTPQQPVGEPL